MLNNSTFSSGSIDLTNVTAKDLNYYTTVAVKNNSTVSNITNGAVKSSYKDTAKNVKSDGMTYKEISRTTTYKPDGKITLSDSSAANITNYKAVTITNGSTKDITLQTIAKTIGIYEVWDGDSFDPTLGPYSLKEFYTAVGTLTAKLDKNAAESAYEMGKITGYKTVTISGYTDKKDSSNNKKYTIKGSIEGGNSEKETNYDDSFSQSASGNVTLTFADVSGNLTAFTTVKLDTANITGNIDKLNDVATTKTSKKRVAWSDESGYDNIISSTTTYKKDGNLTAANSKFANANNYQTVKLTNTIAGNIVRNSLTKTVYEGYYYDYGYGDEYGDDLYKTQETYTAAGSMTATLDKNASKDKSYTVGNISGYANVTISGFVDKKNPDNNLFISTGKITGGNSEMPQDDYESDYENYKKSAAGTLKLTNANTKAVEGFNSITAANTNIDGNAIAASGLDFDDKTMYYGTRKQTHSYKGTYSANSSSYTNKTTDTVTSAGKFTLSDGSVKNIFGYGTVALTNATAADVTITDAYTKSYSYSSSSSWNDNGDKNTVKASSSFSVAKKGTATIKNSTVDSISGYTNVTLVNSNVNGYIEQGNLTKITANYNSQYDSMKEIENSDGKITYEFKSTGSINISADKNATDGFYVINGDISGYDKVTIGGYYDKKTGKNVSINVIGNIFGGRGTTEEYWEGEDIYLRDDVYMSEEKASGSITIKKNVSVNDIHGYLNVNIDTAKVNLINSYINSGETLQGTLTAKDSEIGAIYSYKTVTLTYIDGDTYISGVGNITVNECSIDTIENGENIIINKGPSKINTISNCFDVNTKLTINKNANLNSNNIESISNVILNGTLVINSSYSADKTTGSGELVAANSAWQNISWEGVADSVKKLNLGNTAENFMSSTFEKSDDTAKKAIAWDVTERKPIQQDNPEPVYEASPDAPRETRAVVAVFTHKAEYNGWLSGEGTDLLDTIDYVKFTADVDGELQISSKAWQSAPTSDLIYCGDTAYNIINGMYTMAVTAGESYVIGIERNDANSMSYNIALLS